MKHNGNDRRTAGRRSWRTLVAAVVLLGVGGMASQAAAAPAPSAAADAAAKQGSVEVARTSSYTMRWGIRW